MARFAAPLQQFLDTNCNRLANGEIQWYENETVVPKPVWQDPDFQISQSNPTPLDACGQTPQLLELDGVYTAEVRDSTGAVINTIDNVTGVGGSTSSGTTAADVLYTAPFTGAVQQTVKNRLGKRIYISDFDITPQPTGQRLEIQTVIDGLAALNAEYTLVFGDPGEYNIDLTTTDLSSGSAAVGLIMPSNIHIELRRGSNLRVLANASDDYALLLYPSTTSNSFVFGGGQLIGDISDHSTGTGEGGNLQWFAGCDNCGAIGIEANESWGNSFFITEDQGTNDRARNILLQNIVTRSNRNNGILIDNCDSVDIINHRAFLIGQGASQSGTSDGINITVESSTTALQKITMRNVSTEGAFGSGLLIDYSAMTTGTAYGQSDINIDNIIALNTSYGLDLTSYDQLDLTIDAKANIIITNIDINNTQLASLNLSEFLDGVSSTNDLILQLRGVSLRNPWLSSVGDVNSTYISANTVSVTENFGNTYITSIECAIDDDTFALRPNWFIFYTGGNAVGSTFFINDVFDCTTQSIPSLGTSIIADVNIFPTVFDYRDSAGTGEALFNLNASAKVRCEGTSNTLSTRETLFIGKGTAASTANDTFVQCERGGQDGFIEMDAAGALSFSATASDRRLKSESVEITDTLDKLSRVPVYRGKMAMPGDESTVLDWTYQIADEVAAEFPEEVQGEIDAVDTDGKPIYQRIKRDNNLILWAALKDAHSIITSQGQALIEMDERLTRMEEL